MPLSSEHLCSWKVLSWVSTALSSVEQGHSQSHLGTPECLPGPFCRFLTRNMGSSARLPWRCEGWDSWTFAQGTNGCKLSLKSQRGTPEALLPWMGAKEGPSDHSSVNGKIWVYGINVKASAVEVPSKAELCLSFVFSQKRVSNESSKR